MKKIFSCLCVFGRKQKGLLAFKTLYNHLYFSIYISKGYWFCHKTNTCSKTIGINFDRKNMAIEEAKSKQKAKTVAGNPQK